MFLLLLVIIFSTLYDGYNFLQGRYTLETGNFPTYGRQFFITACMRKFTFYVQQ